MLHHEVNLSWSINKEPVAMSFKTFFSVVSMFHLFIRSWPLYGFCFERINYSNSACISFFHYQILTSLCYKDKNLFGNSQDRCCSKATPFRGVPHLGLLSLVLLVNFIIFDILIQVPRYGLISLFKELILYFFNASL